MAMKQTQTKMFDFADVGLDFCSGSKNLFPDRFKKMLSQGYNEQTVASVSVTGNQVTLNYGVAHGYAADRVIKINSGPLAAINAGEFWIDAVTATSVTMTIDAAPVSIAGGFVTKIASLGWGLVYEQANIQIYKFKHIDDTDMYARLCFQNATTSGNRNCVAVGIGRTVDLNLGHITDPNCLQDLATCATVADATSNVRWDFTSSTVNTFNNYTYSQGVSRFGKGMVVGSQYHFLICFDALDTSSNRSCVLGLVPTISILNFPILLATNNGAPTTSTTSMNASFSPYIGKNRCIFDMSIDTNPTPIRQPQANGDYLPSEIEAFNTMMGKPVPIHLYNPSQFIGFALGMYIACFSASASWNTGKQDTPSIETDIDFNSLIIRKGLGDLTLFLPVEEIKIAN